MTYPHAAFQRYVTQQSENVTVYRRDSGDAQQYGSDVTYSQLASDRSVLIASGSEVEQPSGAGQIQSARFIAFTLPSTDLQVNDRLDHGSRQLEVTAKYGVPEDTNPALYRYELENV